uniref:Ras association domain family member 3 n=1 Tax=Oryzias latipes TaxID=8090 RepID=A0A3P9KEN1_ORYLA
MFNGKYSPTRPAAPDDSPLGVQALFVQKSRLTPPHEAPEATWPPPGAKMRFPKANKGAMVVRPVRRHPSLPSTDGDTESRDAAWGEGRKPKPRSYNGRNGAEAHEGGPHRGRKKSFRPPDVRTIFNPGERDPRVKEESGEGHTFEPGEFTWCDVCCTFILQGGLTCTGCRYACHAACRNKVSLDCHPVSQDRLNNNNNTPAPLHDVEKERELRREFSTEEIRQKIEAYNSMTKDHLKMTLGSHGEYTGFIKVLMDLRRPVTVRGGHKGATVAEEAFYLPQEVNMILHISSNHTARQVVGALLGKFKVVDNPAKYALYKRCRRDEQVYVCKLAEAECPLYLRLLAGPDQDSLSLVLREQQTGEVMWDAFSIPELRNFLLILDKEEQEQKDALIRRYTLYRKRLEEAIRQHRV